MATLLRSVVEDTAVRAAVLGRGTLWEWKRWDRKTERGMAGCSEMEA